MGIVYRKKGDTVARRIAGETLLVPIRGELANMQRIFTLNPVAEYIWQQLDGAHDLEQIQHALANEFEVDDNQAAADLHRFIAELVAADLVVEAA